MACEINVIIIWMERIFWIPRFGILGIEYEKLSRENKSHLKLVCDFLIFKHDNF